MLRKIVVAGAVAGLSLALAGCVVRGTVGTSAYVSTPEPDLVLVEPGVYVVADYQDPVFYNSGYYWLYRDGYWLRSYSHGGGWVRVRSVPYGVRRIHQPYRYRHYRPSARAHVYRPPARRGGSVRRVNRDHRRNDRRIDRRDDRRDRRRDSRDHRGERRRDRD
jgi:hypothetical protein